MRARWHLISVACAFILCATSAGEEIRQHEAIGAVASLSRARADEDSQAAAHASEALLTADLIAAGLTRDEAWLMRIAAAEALANAGRLDEAIAAYEAVLSEVTALSEDVWPEETSDWYTRLAETQEQAGDFFGAATNLGAARAIVEHRLGPEHPELRFYLQLELDLIERRFAARGFDVDSEARLEAERDDLGHRIRTLETIAADERRALVTLGPEVADAPYELVRVFFASNRTRTTSVNPNNAFGDRRAALSYGYADVSVPRTRKLGSLGRPSVFTFLPGALDRQTVVLKRVTHVDDPDAFADAVRRQISAGVERGASPAEAFVYVHGHATTFSDAARRTAQLAVDLDMKSGGTFYAWPAGAAVEYLASERQITDQHVRDFKRFLLLIAERSGAEKLHVIAHSMGNRFLRRALREMALTDGVAPIFDQIVWASPDVDAVEFAESIEGGDDSSAPSILGFAKGMTLYASSRDRALALSRWLGGNYPRAGEASPPPPLVVDGLITVDTSPVATLGFGHADYVGGAFNDLRAVVWFNLMPDARCVLESHPHASGASYWVATTDRTDCLDDDFRVAINAIRKYGGPDALYRFGAAVDPIYRTRVLPIAEDILTALDQ